MDFLRCREGWQQYVTGCVSILVESDKRLFQQVQKTKKKMVCYPIRPLTNFEMLDCIKENNGLNDYSSIIVLRLGFRIISGMRVSGR